MKRTTLAALALAVLALAVAPLFGVTAAAAETAAKPASGTLSFIRVYTGPDGVSRIVDEKLQLKAVGTEGMEAALAVHPIGDVKNATFAMLKAGVTEEFHVAPRRQFMVCLRGLVEVTTEDGQTRRIKPGELVLLEDTKGKGHITKSLGPDDHVALAVPLADNQFVRAVSTGK